MMVLFVFCFPIFAIAAATGTDVYDLAVLNGRVMDPETKLDAVRNIGVKDGRIVVITKDKIKGRESINAKGHVVAPGFIDMHDHTTIVVKDSKVLKGVYPGKAIRQSVMQ